MRSIYFLLLPMALILVSCGGGSGSNTNDDGDIAGPDNGRGNDTKCESGPLTEDMYLSTSYDCSQTSNDSLLGTWMVTSEYKITSSATDKNKQSRFTISITETDSDQLNAFVCSSDPSKRNIRFNSIDNTLNFFDYNAQAEIELTIESNKRMTGKHISSGSAAVVQESEVTAIKIADTVAELGSLNLDYTYNGSSFSESNLNVICFLQDNGSSQNPGLTTQSMGRHLDFIATINNNGTEEYLMSSVFVPEGESQSPSVGLFFIDRQRKIQGRWNTAANYLEQSNLKVSLSAEVTDDYSLKDHAELSLQINL